MARPCGISDYKARRFLDDPTFLSDVVQFDLPLLGEVTDLDGVHLQCHIGTDTVSLARLGAHMTGLDISAASLAESAHWLRPSTPTSSSSRQLYDAVDVLGAAHFDRVHRCRRSCAGCPISDDGERWSPICSDRAAGSSSEKGIRCCGHCRIRATISYRCWSAHTSNVPSPPWDEGGTYVETDAVFTQTRSLEWNHGLGEIVTALLDAGLTITSLVEHDSVPWDGPPGQMEHIGGNEWRLIDRP